MNSRLAIVIVALCTLAVVSARPAEQQSLLSAIFGNFQRNRRQDAVAPAPAATQAEGMKEPNTVPQEGGKAPEPDVFSRQQEMISSGVNNIVKGARGGDLEQILRGSFAIPSNSRVRERAGSILDSIFGNAKQS